MSRSDARSGFGVVAALIACTPREAPTSEDPPAPPPVVEAPPVAAPAPTPAATPPPVAPAPAPPSTTLELELAVRGDVFTSAYAMADGTIVVQNNHRFVLFANDGTVVRDEQLDRGLVPLRPIEVRDEDEDEDEDDASVGEIGGRWPDTAFVDVMRDVTKNGDLIGFDYRAFRWDRGWQHYDNEDHGVPWLYIAYGPWRDGTLLALRNYQVDDDTTPVPTREAFDVIGTSTFPPPRFPTGDDVVTFASLATGHVLAARTPAHASWWQPDQTQSTDLELPHSGPDPLRLTGVDLIDPTHGYVWGAVVHPDKTLTPYLAAWNGTGFTAIDAPGCGGITALDIEADGSAWWITQADFELDRPKTCRGELWRRTSDATIKRVRVAAEGDDSDLEPTNVIVRGEDDVWVVADREARRRRSTVVLRSQASARPIELRELELPEDLAGTNCNAVFLSLDPKRAPSPARIRALQSALRSIEGELDGSTTIDVVAARGHGYGLLVRADTEHMKDAVDWIDHDAHGIDDTLCGEPEVAQVLAPLVPAPR